MKHVLLGLKEKDINKALEQDTDNLIADYTFRNHKLLKQSIPFFKPDSLILSADLKSEPYLVDDLLTYHQAAKQVRIILFINKVSSSDTAMIKAVGKLLKSGIYPILAKASLEDITNFLAEAPAMTPELKKFYEAYNKLLEKEERAKHQIKPVDKFKVVKLDQKDPAKLIGFTSARPNVGKKFVLSNFAYTLANGYPNKKIVLIDLDTANNLLGEELGISEENSKFDNIVKAIKTYTTQSKFKKSDQEVLQKQFKTAFNDSFAPLANTKNLFALVHKTAGKAIDNMNKSDNEFFLKSLKDSFDVVLLNLSCDSLNLTKMAPFWDQLDVIYSVISMDKRDINANLQLKQEYASHHIFDHVHYVLNKYEDKNYLKALDEKVIAPLAFDKDLLNMYGLNVTNIIPNIEPNIIYNESFTGSVLANEKSEVTEYPRTAFKLLVDDSGYGNVLKDA